MEAPLDIVLWLVYTHNDVFCFLKKWFWKKCPRFAQRTHGNLGNSKDYTQTKCWRVTRNLVWFGENKLIGAKMVNKWRGMLLSKFLSVVVRRYATCHHYLQYRNWKSEFILISSYFERNIPKMALAELYDKMGSKLNQYFWYINHSSAPYAMYGTLRHEQWLCYGILNGPNADFMLIF